MRFLILSSFYLTLTFQCHGEPRASDTKLLLEAMQKMNEVERLNENLEDEPSPPDPPARPSLYDLNFEVLPWMFDVDMLLSEDQARNLLEGAKEASDRHKRAAIIDSRYHWDPQVPIYYRFDQSITNNSNTLAMVNLGIKFWTGNTCLNFQYNPSAFNVLNIFVGVGCWSYVGKQNTLTQDVSIGYGCEGLGTITHELAHALGFYHQQSRYDRDNYIMVNFSNIAVSLQYNFLKQTAATETHFGWPYDYSSIMQYSSYAFALDPNYPTIVAKKSDYQSSMGQRDAPAFSDVVMVNTLYNCSNLCQSLPSCQNNGIPNSRNCSTCLCPNIYTGDLCTDLKQGNAYKCAGSKLQADQCWKTMNGSAGNPKDYTALEIATDCYWLIEAPEDSKIELQFLTMPLCRTDGCPWQWLEVSLDDFILGGMQLCCPTNQTFVSRHNKIGIRAAVKWNQAKFSLKYRIYSNDTMPC